jgi:hypothetical protein
MSQREVVRAEMHGPSFAKGVGEIPKTLAATADSKTKDLKMLWTPGDNFLTVIIKGVEVILPLSNVQSFQCKPESK